MLVIGLLPPTGGGRAESWRFHPRTAHAPLTHYSTLALIAF